MYHVIVRDPVPQQQPQSVNGKQFFSFDQLLKGDELTPTVVQSDQTVSRVPLANTFEWIGNLRSIVDFGLDDQVQ